MGKIDIDKFVTNLVEYSRIYEHYYDALPQVLKDQGLEYDLDKGIVEICEENTQQKLRSTLKTQLDDALSKETKESWNEFLDNEGGLTEFEKELLRYGESPYGIIKENKLLSIAEKEIRKRIVEEFDYSSIYENDETIANNST